MRGGVEMDPGLFPSIWATWGGVATLPQPHAKAALGTGASQGLLSDPPSHTRKNRPSSLPPHRFLLFRGCGDLTSSTGFDTIAIDCSQATKQKRETEVRPLNLQVGKPGALHDPGLSCQFQLLLVALLVSSAEC